MTTANDLRCTISAMNDFSNSMLEAGRLFGKIGELLDRLGLELSESASATYRRLRDNTRAWQIGRWAILTVVLASAAITIFAGPEAITADNAHRTPIQEGTPASSQ